MKQNDQHFLNSWTLYIFWHVMSRAVLYTRIDVKNGQITNKNMRDLLKCISKLLIVSFKPIVTLIRS